MNSTTDETYLEAYIEQLTTSQWTYQIRRIIMDLLRDMDYSCQNDLQTLLLLSNQFHTYIEQYMIHQYDIVEIQESMSKNDKNEENERTTTVDGNNNKKRKRPRYGLRPISPIATSNDNTIINKKAATDKKESVTIPTTEELIGNLLYQTITTTTTTNNNDSSNDTSATTTTTTTTVHEMLQQIKVLQQSCLQKSNEKVNIVQQAYDIINAQVQRLDQDIHNMEVLLQSTGELQKSSMGPPNNIHHGNNLQQSQHHQQTQSLSSGHSNHTNASMSLSTHPGAATTTTASSSSSSVVSVLAACQVSPGSEYILCKILYHDPVRRIYQLHDEDIESTNKIFDLPESQVIVLNPIERLGKGDTIYAVYPDTTSFYQATVVQMPKKMNPTAIAAAYLASSSSVTATSAPFVMVHFNDDADEFGITHDKAVPIQHIMLPPPSL